MGLLLYDPRGAPEQLFTLADDGNGSAVRIPVLLLPRASAARLLELLAERRARTSSMRTATGTSARRLLQGEATSAGGQAGEQEEDGDEDEEGGVLVELEGLEVTVRTEEGPAEPLDEPDAETEAEAEAAAAAAAGHGADALPKGTAVRCHLGSDASDGASGCTRQHPVDPWSIEDAMWDALRCSTAG